MCRPRKPVVNSEARGRHAAASSDGSDDDSGSEYEPAAEEAAAAAEDEAVVDLTLASDSDGDADGAPRGQVIALRHDLLYNPAPACIRTFTSPARSRCRSAIAMWAAHLISSQHINRHTMRPHICAGGF